MGNHLHQRLNLNAGDIVEVGCDTQCNVMLMSDSSYSTYKRGGCFSYHGGFFKMFPARIAAPSTGVWNVVLDLGGGSATVRHSVRVIPA